MLLEKQDLLSSIIYPKNVIGLDNSLSEQDCFFISNKLDKYGTEEYNN